MGNAESEPVVNNSKSKYLVAEKEEEKVEIDREFLG